MAMQQEWASQESYDRNPNPYGIPSFSGGGGGGGGMGAGGGGNEYQASLARPGTGNVQVLEAAASVLEEKLAAASLETAVALEARHQLEEKLAALAQENAWLHGRVKSLQAEMEDEHGGTRDREENFKRELAVRTAERDAATAAMKGQLQELRVGASAVGAKIALTEEVERLKAQIAPLQAALEAERSWAREMEQQLEGEKTAKLALVAKSGAMVKALRQQLEEAKTQQHVKTAVANGGGHDDATLQAEADAKQALQAKQALEREVQWLKDRVKSLQADLDSEKAKARDKELRQKGKFDATLEKAISDREAAVAHTYKAQVEELQTKVLAAQVREKELLGALQQAVVAGGLITQEI